MKLYCIFITSIGHNEQLHNLSTVVRNVNYTIIDLLLQLQLDNAKLRLLRIYGNSIERKDYVGPYYNKEVRTYIRSSLSGYEVATCIFVYRCSLKLSLIKYARLIIDPMPYTG